MKLPMHEIEFSYARSSGPGGQNVNKTNTKVVLRWNLGMSNFFPKNLRNLLIQKLQARLTENFELVITSDRFRDRLRNQADVVEKLRDLLIQATEKPKPRVKTKPTRASKKRRMERKRKTSETKNLRKKIV